MTITQRFEIVLMLVATCIALTAIARRLRLPQASALIAGGIALALVPGVPTVEIDSELVLVLFMPPLLLQSAYLTDWRSFRSNLRIISQLAIGAVAFTTFAVGWVTHLVAPSLPLAACFALGAIVSPPDAVAAKAVLHGLKLPSRVVTLLEGESLVNDASGLVLYRIAVVATLTGTFSGASAAGTFVLLITGGIALGVAFGYIASILVERFLSDELAIATGLLTAWGSYILGDRLGVSGVLATVSCGIVMGWRQHAYIDAKQRFQKKSIWGLIAFTLESLIFILIGLSLREVLGRLHMDESSLTQTVWQVCAVTAAVIVSRFLWIVPVTYGTRFLFPGLRQRDPYPPFRIPLVMSWAGMRGVVSLAAALSLPNAFPGRDLILLATFVVILVTVVFQGATLAPLIRRLHFDRGSADQPAKYSEEAARARIISAQIAVVNALFTQSSGQPRHPRLLEQLKFRLNAVQRELKAEDVGVVRTEHFAALLEGIEAGRAELIRMFKSGELDPTALNALETELDADEIRARHLLTPAGS